MSHLVKITFPYFDSYLDSLRFYRNMNEQFDKARLIYLEDYEYHWNNTGKHVPDYITLDEETALVFILRYGCKRVD